MSVKKHIDDIIHDEIYLKMDASVTVVYATPPAVDGGIVKQNIRLCNMKWMKLYNFMYQDFSPGVSPKWEAIEFNGQDFKVTIPYEDGELFVGDVLRLEKPHYHRGTNMAVNAELQEHQKVGDLVFPLMCLSYSPAIKQRWFDDPSEPLDRISEIKMIAATYADFTNKFTKDHLVDNIEPLNGLIAEFMETIKRRPIFKNIGLMHETVEYPRHGRETMEGIVSNVFDAMLSAVELRCSLPIKKGKHCDC